MSTSLPVPVDFEEIWPVFSSGVPKSRTKLVSKNRPVGAAAWETRPVDAGGPAPFVAVTTAGLRPAVIGG